MTVNTISSYANVSTDRVGNLCSNIVDKAVSSGAIYANNLDGGKRLLTAEEATDLKAIFTNSTRSNFADMQTIEQARSKIVKVLV